MVLFERNPSAAAEQLYDELLARSWSLRQLAPGVVADPASPSVLDHLADTAIAAVHDAEHDATAGGSLRRLLWPSGSEPRPDDPWWDTPLGRLLAGRPPRGDRRRRTTLDPARCIHLAR